MVNKNCNGNYFSTTYKTLQEAKSACLSDFNCGKVYQGDCLATTFSLCPKNSNEASSASCLYVKTGKYLINKVSYMWITLLL